MSPSRCSEMSVLILKISAPSKAVIGHLIPFFARDFASFAADANRRIGEEANLNAITHVRVPTLVRALDSFADHPALLSLPRIRENFPPLGAPSGGCSGCKLAG